MTTYGNPICSYESTQTDGFDSLTSLALDLRWSWNHEADELWYELDPVLWEQTHNPWIILQTVSGDVLKSRLSSPVFRAKLEGLLKQRESADAAPSWFSRKYPDAPLSCIAYFSMEFMLSEALPIYVGGLGNVAGDQLKSASDLGVPVVGVGLLYQQGYFRQVIDANGQQQAYYPYNDPGQLPIAPLREPNGEWLRLQIPFPAGPVWLRVWQVQAGRVKLYLLDSNDAANSPLYRQITGELYGGDSEMRIQQEIVLGIGGWQLLETLGIQPEVCHLNEGHAAFAVLERARHFMIRSGLSFPEALTVTRAGNLFTSHTAVAAGFDHFPPSLVGFYLGDYATRKLHISIADLLALGRQYPHEPTEGFNMAYLAINGSGHINGVSSLHGRVSRHLFEPLFYRWPTEEVPVGHVTNGVHMPSWDAASSDELWTEACGKDRWMNTTEALAEDIRRLPNDRIWEMRTIARKALVTYIQQRLSAELTASGADTGAIGKSKEIFDPNTLTLGFARRFVAYKRPDLLLHDPNRLVRLLTNVQQPVQLVIAGKAPPSDEGGKALIRRWIQFIRQYDMSAHVIFLGDYDMLLAEHLVEGVDVWLNTPQRPWEASGTSGMKVLVNGGLNVSELDGWWAEAYTPKVGWALGDGQEHGNDPAWDALEAEALYKILEEEVVPTFYSRGKDNIPASWVEKVKESMATLTPYFNANRTVREYTDSFYMTGAKAYRERSVANGALGKSIVQWKRSLEPGWNDMHFGEVTVHTENNVYPGEEMHPEEETDTREKTHSVNDSHPEHELRPGYESQSGESWHLFEVQVYTGPIDPVYISVELYAQGINGATPIIQELSLTQSASQDQVFKLYKGKVPATRPMDDYTARIIPQHIGVAVPLEAAQITWQK